MLTVTEGPNGINVRQDRFLATGSAQPKDNETVWTVPLSLLTVNDKGDVVINKNAVLDEREKSISLDVNKPWKLNAGTVSFCRLSTCRSSGIALMSLRPGAVLTGAPCQDWPGSRQEALGTLH